MKKDKTLVFVIIFAVVLFFFSILDTPTANLAATQRASLLSDIATPQQLASSRIAFFIFIPLGAAYFFYMWSRPKHNLKEIWNNIGGKVGLVAGFLSIFILKNQIPFYLVTIALMTTLGMWIHKKFGMNAIRAFLVIFIPAYYYMLVQVMSQKSLELATFFNIISFTIFLWIIPIIGGMVIYALYKGYIPMINKLEALR